MSMESDLQALLTTLCGNVYPDVAPEGAARPSVTWQGIGGETLRFVGNEAADKRHTLLQINAWSETRQEALALIRQVEDALCSAVVFTASPQGEPINTHEPDTRLYGSIQRFNVWSTR